MQLTLPDIMRCLITPETRPCEDPINFEVLLLPITLTIIKNIRLFALLMYQGLIVRTPEQGKDFAINLQEKFKETSVLLPSSRPHQKQSPPEGTLSPVGLAAPSTHVPLCQTCCPRPRSSNTYGELLPKDPRGFCRENIYVYFNSEAAMSGGNCMPTHSPHFKTQKVLRSLQVPTKRTRLQFFTCGTKPESSEVQGKISSHTRNPFL